MTTESIDEIRKSAGELLEKNKITNNKFIRDPIHDIIKIEYEVILKLLNSTPMQRLRRIRQLGNTSFVYPGAEHSRFSHSLGVYHLARRILDQINETDTYDRVVVMIAALLHDVGHGPFSHLFETVLKKTGYGTEDDYDHEKWTLRIIRENKEINDILNKYGSTLLADVRSIIDKTHTKRHLISIVSSQLDADRFDYMMRDSHMTGVHYGRVDINWLLRNLKKRKTTLKDENYEPERVVIDIKRGVSTLQDYILGNLNLYKNVYLHKTVQAADAMVISLLIRAIDLLKAGNNDIGFKNKTLEKIAKNDYQNKITLEEYIALDDNVILSWIAKWASYDYDEVLHKISKDFISRNLFKIVDITKINDDDKYFAFRTKLQQEFENSYVMFLELKRKSYKPLDPNGIMFVEGDDDEPKYFRTGHPTVNNDYISLAIASGNVKFEKRILAVSSDIYKTVEEIKGEY